MEDNPVLKLQAQPADEPYPVTKTSDLLPRPDLRSPDDPECREIRRQALLSSRTPPRDSAIFLRRETAAMKRGGYMYWLCDKDLVYRPEHNWPHVLLVQGVPLTAYPRVAMVGPRKNDPYGGHMAATFSESLARAGIVVVSGGAAGIDTISHVKALEAGGRTLCVTGNGFDRPFPESNTELFSSLGRPGPLPYAESCLISEYSPSQPAARHTFIERNRIVAGLSDAVIVIEADYGSGAIITARLALEMNIPVFAVPADITWKGSRATNDLLGQGARPLCRPGDLACVPSLTPYRDALAASNPEPVARPRGYTSPWSRPGISAGPRKRISPNASELAKQVEKSHSETGQGARIDELSDLTGLNTGSLQAALLELELAGKILRVPGNRVIPLRHAVKSET